MDHSNEFNVLGSLSGENFLSNKEMENIYAWKTQAELDAKAKMDKLDLCRVKDLMQQNKIVELQQQNSRLNTRANINDAWNNLQLLLEQNRRREQYLEVCCKSLSEQRDQYKEEMRDRQKRIAIREGQIADLEKNYKNMLDTFVRLRDQTMRQHEAKLGRIEGETAALTRQLKDKLAELEEAQQAQKRHKKAVEELHMEAETNQAELTEKMAKLKSLCDEKKKLEGLVSQRKQALRSSKQNYEEINAEQLTHLDNTEEKCSALGTKVTQVKDEIAIKSNKCLESSKVAELLKIDVASLESQLRELEVSLDGSKADVANLRQANKVLQANEAELAKLQPDFSELQEDYAACEEKRKQAESEVTALRKVQKQKFTLEEENVTLCGKVEMQEGKLAEAEQERAQLSQAKIALNDSLEKVKAEVRDKEDRIDSLSCAASKEDSLLAECRHTAETDRRGMSNKIERLTADLSRSSEEMTSLLDKKSKAEQTLAAERAEEEALQSRSEAADISQLEAKVLLAAQREKELTEKIDKLEAARNSYLEAAKEHEQEVERLKARVSEVSESKEKTTLEAVKVNQEKFEQASKLEAELKNLTDKLAAETKSSNETRKALAQAEGSLDLRKKTVDRLESQLEKSEQKIRELRTQGKECEKLLAETAKEAEACKVQLDSTSRDITCSTANEQSNNEHNWQLEQKVRELEDKLNTCEVTHKEAMATADEVLAKTNADREVLEAGLVELEEKLAERKAKTDSAGHLYGEAQEEADDLKQQVKSRGEQEEAVKTVSMELRAAEEEKRKCRTLLEHETTQNNEIIRDLRKNQKQVVKSCNDKIKELEEKIREKEESTIQLEGTIRSLADKCTEEEENVAGVEEELQAANKQIASLRKELEDRKAEAETIKEAKEAEKKAVNLSWSWSSESDHETEAAKEAGKKTHGWSSSESDWGEDDTLERAKGPSSAGEVKSPVAEDKPKMRNTIVHSYDRLQKTETKKAAAEPDKKDKTMLSVKEAATPEVKPKSLVDGKPNKIRNTIVHSYSDRFRKSQEAKETKMVNKKSTFTMEFTDSEESNTDRSVLPSVPQLSEDSKCDQKKAEGKPTKSPATHKGKIQYFSSDSDGEANKPSKKPVSIWTLKLKSKPAPAAKKPRRF